MTAFEALETQETEIFVCHFLLVCLFSKAFGVCMLNHHPVLFHLLEFVSDRVLRLCFLQDDPRCLNIIEFDRLLRESQREVLRLQRQIALKNFKDCLRSSQTRSGNALPSAATRPGPPVPTPNTCITGSPLPQEACLGEPALAGEAHRQVRQVGQPSESFAT